MNEEEFRELLTETQEYISRHYASALSDGEKTEQLRAYIAKYLKDRGTDPAGTELVARLYEEMAEYSVLTPLLSDPRVEEINLNAWDELWVHYRDGRAERVRSFSSPEKALDIVRRLLRHAGAVLDNATPIAQGHLPGNKRITAIKTPVVDERTAVAASLRMLNAEPLTLTELIAQGTADAEMLGFLCDCLCYGVSFVVAGPTSSGKTTLLNSLVGAIPPGRRIFSIESGARELHFCHVGEADPSGPQDHLKVQTLSRPSEKAELDVSQEALGVAALRFSPELIAIGEMRDTEAATAVEASLTGHTVVSTIHAGSAENCHLRLALLCQKRFPIEFSASMMQTVLAFPVVVNAARMPDHSRKIVAITEACVTPEGKICYRPLYQWEGGTFVRKNAPGEKLTDLMIRHGLDMKGGSAWLGSRSSS